MTDRELVARIARSAGQKAGYKQLVRELSLGGETTPATTNPTVAKQNGHIMHLFGGQLDR